MDEHGAVCQSTFLLFFNVAFLLSFSSNKLLVSNGRVMAVTQQAATSGEENIFWSQNRFTSNKVNQWVI